MTTNQERALLKRCPHCGGPASLNSNYSYWNKIYFVFVRCDICSAQGKPYTAGTDPSADDWSGPACRDAVAAWNMRTGGR